MRRLLPLAFLLACAFSAAPVRALEVRVLDLRANDILYNRFDGLIYASIPSGVPDYGNRIVRIDPRTLSLTSSLPVGSEPAKLAISSDGSKLYVGLDGSGAVATVNLPAFTAGPTFSLGNDPFTGPYYADDMAVQPGSPNVVAISLRNRGFSPRHEGVAIFDGGVARPDRTPGHTGSNGIEFSDSPGRLYGQNIETTEYGFRRMNVTASGVTTLESTQNLINGWDIRYDHGRIYSVGGHVIEPESRTLLGRFTIPDISYNQAMVPDSNRAYFVSGQSYALRLFEFDTADFTPILDQVIPGVSGPARSMVRWGAEGLAFIGYSLFNADGKIVILDRIHEPPAADLAVVQRDEPSTVAPGQPMYYRIRVRNLGPADAEDVVLRARHPDGFDDFQWSRGSCYDSSGTMVCTLGGIASDDSATVYVMGTPSQIGAIENVAWVQSTTFDPNPANNLSIERTPVQRPASADVFLRLPIGPSVGVAGRPFTVRLPAGNAGPDSSGDRTMFYVNPYFGVRMEVVSISSPRGTCSWDSSGLGGCEIGRLAPGDSFEIAVVLRARSAGPLALTFYMDSDVSDPNPSNQAVYFSASIVESAEYLIDQLLSLVRGYELKSGPEKTLVDPLVEAREALLERDTTRACHEMSSFVDALERRAGRGLTIPQAYALLNGANVVQAVLGCTGTTLAPGKRNAKPHDAEAAAPPVAPSPAHLSLQWAAGAERSRVLEWVMPVGGRAKVDVHDLQGRRIGILVDRELPAGLHRFTWTDGKVEGRSLSSGVYFLRLSVADRSTVMKATLLD